MNIKKLFLFIAVCFLVGQSVAFAGFVRTSVQEEEEESLNQINGAAAAVEALPAKTDGEIVDCFDYYRFPSVQTSFDTLKEFYEPGQTVYFRGELINENSYPIIDGYLFVRIGRYNENYTQEWHDIADEFFANSGPQGREKFYLEGKEKKGVVFSWNAPENLPDGVYTASFSFIVGKKMNLAGLSFTNEINAGSTNFEVGKSATGAQRVFLEKSSFAVNGKKYDHIGLSPVFDKDAKVEVAGKIRNDTAQKANLKLTYDLYYWDGLDDKNKISSRSEDIIITPNSSHSFQYVIPKMDETVYFLRIATIAGNGQKSIVNLRFLSEQEKPRINFFSPMKFPVLRGETMTNFACFHNTADKSLQGKVTMNVFDESGDKIQTLGYEGEITGRIMAVKKDAVVAKNYDYLKMTASVAGIDGRETDSYEMIYDCKNMNPENKECAKIQEEKAIAGTSAQSSNKKDIMFGIAVLAAIAAIAAIAALSRKLFFNKAKSPLISLFFALAVSSVVFLAIGMGGNYALAKNVQLPLKEYNFPPNVNCDKNVQGKGVYVGPIWDGDPLWICVGGNVQINHIIENDIKNNVLKKDDKINFSYTPDEPFYYATSGANDSPYGRWCSDLSSCRDSSYEKIGWIGKNDQATTKDDIDMTWLAVKPAVSISSDNSSVVLCVGMTCTAQGQGNARLTANIGRVTARPWLKVSAGKGWEGYRYDYKGDEKMHDLEFDGTTLTWDITVDAPPPTCEASFSPAEINKDKSSLFRWSALNDEGFSTDGDGLVPITCTAARYNYNYGPSDSFYVFPSSEENQISCTATVDNGMNESDSVKTCSATVEVRSVVDKTCSDGIQNQDETGVDTGGVCIISSSSSSSSNNYDLTVNITGSGSGLIYNVNEPDSTRGGKTWYDYANGTMVKLQATADSDSRFSGGWVTSPGGNCAGGVLSTRDKTNDTCEITMGGADKSLTVSFDSQSSTSSSIPSTEPGIANLTLKKNGDGNVKLYAWDDSFNSYNETVSNNFQNNETRGLKKDWWFKMSAAPDSGSYFSGWSGCTASDPKDTAPASDENACFVTMTDNKTATVTFGSSSGPGGPPGGPTGGSSVKAYISAQNTVVTDGNSTVVTWTSDNATSCEQKEGGSDTGWISANDTISGDYTTNTFTTSGGSRTYKVTCVNGPQEANAEVAVSVGDGYGSPSVTMWADPQSVGYKKTSMIQWLSSNIFPNSCLLFSVADTMNGYLAYFNFPPKQYFGPGYYKSGINQNNSTGQKTGKLASNTTYKIQCQGLGFTNVQSQTTVTVAKPVSNFTFTNPSGASLVATIVEGLSANSSSVNLAFSGESIGNVSLSASIPAISGAKAQFSSDDGAAWSDTLSIDISAITQVKIKVVKIPGATAIGTYNVALTAKDTGTGGITKKLNVNLQVSKVSSEWEEF